MEFLPETPTIATRRIAILLADGFDYAAYTIMKEVLQKHKAFVFTIGSQRQGVKAESGETVVPDHHFSGMRSTLYDATFVPGGKQHIAALRKNGVPKYWITESFGHLKPIAGLNEAVEFIERQIGLDAVKYAAASSKGSVTGSYGVVTGHGSPEDTLKVSNVSSESKGLAEKFIWEVSRHRNWQRELDGLMQEVAA